METFEKPTVSIALCTYNGEKFLRKLLESLLVQDYEDIEVIAVDDYSSDGTYAILAYYAGRDKRLKVYQNERNLGYAGNFEKAIKLCSADFIALADQDDIWEKNKISVMMNSIKDCVMIYHDSDFIDEQDERIGQETMASRWRMYEGESCLPFILSNCVSGHAILFRRELINYIYPFVSNHYHDWWLAYVAFNIGKVKFVNDVLVHYRQHENAVTDSLELRKIVVKKKLKDSLEINVDWLTHCSNFKYNRDPILVKKAYTHLINLKEGKNRFQVLIFMIKHFDLLFFVSGKPRGFLSKLNFTRKICFS